MASAARAAQGTLLKIGDGGGPETFTTIAEVRSLSGPSLQVDTEDVTSHDSTAYHEFIPTLIDAGEITFNLNFTNHATQGFSTGLYNDMVNRTKRNFQLVIPTATPRTGAFAGYVTGMPFDLPHDGVIRADVTIKITGAVTWT